MSTQICCRDRCEIEVVLLKRKDFGSITGRCKNACKKYYFLVWFILKRIKFARLWKKNLYRQNLRWKGGHFPYTVTINAPVLHSTTGLYFQSLLKTIFSRFCVVRFCDKMLLIRVLPGYGEDACTKSKTDGDKATYVENCTSSMIKYNECFRLRLKSGKASHDHPTTRWWNSIRIYVRRMSNINHAWQFEIHSQRRMHKTPSWRANLHF